MRNIFKHKIALLLISATLVCAILIGVFSVRTYKANFAEDGVMIALSPLQKILYNIGGRIYGVTHYFGNISALRDENRALTDENVKLEKHIQDMQSLEDENERLKDMLEFKKNNGKLELEAVMVIAKDPSNWYSTFTVDKGAANGIELGMPVVTSQQYLVGQISRVGTTWAEVVTILDPVNSVGSIIRRSRDVGIVGGDHELRYSRQCKMSYLARDTDIQEGDYVETSGLGGVYPQGITIGKVLTVMDDNSTMSKVATIEPLADISKVTELFVITNSAELLEGGADLSPTPTPEPKNDNEDKNPEDTRETDDPSIDNERRTDRPQDDENKSGDEPQTTDSDSEDDE